MEERKSGRVGSVETNLYTRGTRDNKNKKKINTVIRFHVDRKRLRAKCKFSREANCSHGSATVQNSQRIFRRSRRGREKWLFSSLRTARSNVSVWNIANYDGNLYLREAENLSSMIKVSAPARVSSSHARKPGRLNKQSNTLTQSPMTIEDRTL